MPTTRRMRAGEEKKHQCRRKSRESFLSFTCMATLTRYTSFKSLKQHSPAKVKDAGNTPKKLEEEMESFFHLLRKKKAKVKAKKA